ncbi:LIC_12616 family protein [Erwinia sp. HR93]|uniref:phage neck terminator protein n=1 Tax=Erwinia sp. HR93 TaxID=3094840 RepID=UPI002ADEB6BC|nr:hypothetical protein [Erwinia sp. HR93]MEA1064744.1 hypothetical protein [Erwinia sp. HR93]
MAITMRSRFELERLRVLIAEGLGISDVLLGDTGHKIPKGAFITLREISSVELGIPERRQISDTEEEIRQHNQLLVSAQAYGPGAMAVLNALSAWLASTPGMEALASIDTSSPTCTLPRNISGAVPSGWEQRAAMEITLTYSARYAVALPIIETVPVCIATAEGSINFEIER